MWLSQVFFSVCYEIVYCFRHPVSYFEEEPTKTIFFQNSQWIEALANISRHEDNNDLRKRVLEK